MFERIKASRELAGILREGMEELRPSYENKLFMKKRAYEHPGIRYSVFCIREKTPEWKIGYGTYRPYVEIGRPIFSICDVRKEDGILGIEFAHFEDDKTSSVLAPKITEYSNRRGIPIFVVSHANKLLMHV